MHNTMSVITAIRRVLAVKQSELATIVGRNQATISRWEMGLGSPTIDDISKIRAEFIKRGVEWDETLIFPPDPDPKASPEAAA